MSTIRNARDQDLDAALTRVVRLDTDKIILSSPTTTIITSSSGTTPTTLSIVAVPTGNLKGNVTWSGASGAVSGNTITISGTAVPLNGYSTIYAYLDYLGNTYSSNIVLSRITEGVSGASGVPGASGASGQSGYASYSLDLSNESHTILTNQDGTDPVFTGATTTARIYLGGQELQNYTGWSFGTSASTGIGISGANTRTIAVTGITVDAGTVAISGYSGSTVLFGTFSLTRSSVGSYSVIPSVDSIVKNANGTLTPANITANAKSLTKSGTLSDYYGVIRIAYSTNGGSTYNSGISGSGTALTYSGINTGSTHVRLELFKSGSAYATADLLDQEVIPLVPEGASGSSGFNGQSGQSGQSGYASYSLDLSNESHTILTNQDGTDPVFTGATTTARIYLGGQELQNYTGWSFGTSASTGIGISGANTRTIAVTGITVDAGTVAISGYSGSTVLFGTFSLTRSSVGSYSVVPSVDSIVKNANGTLTPASIIARAKSLTKSGTLSDYYGHLRIAYSIDGGVSYTSSTTGSGTSLGYSAYDSTATHVRLELFKSGSAYAIADLLDQEVIPVIPPGASGSSGFNGQSGQSGYSGATNYSLDLSNESHTILTNPDGSNAIFTGASTTARIYFGGRELTDYTGWNFGTSASTGIGISGANTRTIAVTGITVDAGTVAISGYSGNTTLFGIFSLTRSSVGSFSIVPSVDSIIKNNDNTLTPANITGSAKTLSRSGTLSDYYGVIRISYSTNGGTTYLSGNSGSGTSLAYNSINVSGTHIKLELFKSGSAYAAADLLDTEVVPVIPAGASGSSGTPGQSGASGTPGQSGFSGTPGQSGYSGAAGQSGATGSAWYKTSESVDQSTLSGYTATTITSKFTDFTGRVPVKDDVFTIAGITVGFSGTSVATASTYTNVATSTVTGSGSGLRLTIKKTGTGTAYSNANTSIFVTNFGSGYTDGNQVKILGTALGGATPANDLTITLTDLSTDIIRSWVYTGSTWDAASARIDGTLVVDGTIRARAISVDSLSAISADLGEVTASTISTKDAYQSVSLATSTTGSLVGIFNSSNSALSGTVLNITNTKLNFPNPIVNIKDKSNSVAFNQYSKNSISFSQNIESDKGGLQVNSLTSEDIPVVNINGSHRQPQLLVTGMPAPPMVQNLQGYISTQVSSEVSDGGYIYFNYNSSIGPNGIFVGDRYYDELGSTIVGPYTVLDTTPLFSLYDSYNISGTSIPAQTKIASVYEPINLAYTADGLFSYIKHSISTNSEIGQSLKVYRRIIKQGIVGGLTDEAIYSATSTTNITGSGSSFSEPLLVVGNKFEVFSTGGVFNKNELYNIATVSGNSFTLTGISTLTSGASIPGRISEETFITEITREETSQYCSIREGSTTVTVEDSSVLIVGQYLGSKSPGIQENTRISSIINGTTITIDKAATANSNQIKCVFFYVIKTDKTLSGANKTQALPFAIITKTPTPATNNTLITNVKLEHQDTATSIKNTSARFRAATHSTAATYNNEKIQSYLNTYTKLNYSLQTTTDFASSVVLGTKDGEAILIEKGKLSSSSGVDIELSPGSRIIRPSVNATSSTGTTSIDLGSNSYGFNNVFARAFSSADTSRTLVISSTTVDIELNPGSRYIRPSVNATSSTAASTSIYLGSTTYGFEGLYARAITNVDTTRNLLITASAAKDIVFSTDSTNAVMPLVTNNTTLGSSSYRWKTIYANAALDQPSDVRLKTDIKSINTALDLISSLRPVEYRPINSEDDKVHMGLIAQEVESVLGNNYFALAVNPDGMYSLKYTEFIAPLIKAVQELSQQVAQLQSEIEILKGRQ